MTSSIDKFDYSSAPQGSPEWVDIRVGKPSSSNLYRWLAISKRDGSPLQARKDYEAELAFENKFKVPFSRFVNAAMENGSMMEEFLKRQYETKEKVTIQPAGCYYNLWFVASPDGLIGMDGLIECKWVYDKTFSEVLIHGVPEAHFLQIQGQLWASKRKWCDYVVGNQNTGKMVVIRVKRDKETIDAIRASLLAADPKDIKFVTDNIFDFSEPPIIASGRFDTPLDGDF